MRITGVVVDKRLFLVLIAVSFLTVFLTATAYANTPPNATIENITGYENTNITFNVSATDIDGDPLTYSSDNPKVRWNGTHLYYETNYDTIIHPNLTKTIAVNITANDTILIYTQEVNITILDVNRAPYYIKYPINEICNITQGWTNLDEDSATEWRECANLSSFTIDPDGDAMSYLIYGYQTGPISPLSYFSEDVCQYHIDENNTFSYRVLENYVGNCYIFIGIADNYGLGHINSSGILFWTKVINPTDDPPELNLTDKIFYENELADLTVPPKDIDGDAMTYTTNDTRFEWDGTKLFWNTTYDAIQHPELAINLSINVTGTDGKTSDSQIVDMILFDVNRAPYYINHPINDVCNITHGWTDLDEDSATEWRECVNLSSFTIDPDGDAMSYSLYGYQTGPVSPLLFFSEDVCQYNINENNTFEYRVLENYVGNCYISINLADSYGLEHINSSGILFWIRVINPTNDAPFVRYSIPTITLDEDEYNDTWTPISYFADYESNPIFFSILNGINIFADNITWNFTAGTPNWFGEENLTLTATDNINDTTINLTVKVLPVNDKPVINPISDISENESEIISIIPTATDVDSIILTFNANNSNLVWNTTSSAFEWTPDYYDFGNHTINMTVSDNLLDDSTVFNIEVLRKRYGFSIELIQGCNFISIPYQLDNTTVAAIMSGISSDHTIWAYNSSTDSWQDYDSTRPPNLNNLTDIQAGQGFWINISDNETLTITGTKPPETGIVLNKGWNMISYPLNAKSNINDTLQAISGKYDIVWQYNASDEENWTFYSPLPEASPANTLHEFTPGYSYWINMTEAADLTFSY